MEKQNKIPTDFPKELYGFCMNDEKPQFPVMMWIQKGRLYKADPESLVLSHGDHVPSFIWSDADGNEIIPNGKAMVKHIKANRFIGFSVCLN